MSPNRVVMSAAEAERKYGIGIVSQETLDKIKANRRAADAAYHRLKNKPIG